jgi:hypothetical protein
VRLETPICLSSAVPGPAQLCCRGCSTTIRRSRSLTTRNLAIQVIRRLKRPIDPSLTPELVEKARTYPRFSRLGLSDDAVYQAASKSINYSQFVSVLCSEHAELNGNHLAGEKCPGFVRYLPRPQALFPRTLIIHIIRDGRDVALSMLEWTRQGRGRRGHSSFGKKNRYRLRVVVAQ